MNFDLPPLLIGTSWCFVGEVPSGGSRFGQVHFNVEVSKKFFNLEPGEKRPVTLEKISPSGRVEERSNRSLVFSKVNRNAKIEFNFGVHSEYPDSSDRPLLVVVEADPGQTYRYRTLWPGDDGYAEVRDLVYAGSRVGRGVRRRIVTLDDLEEYWPQSALRGRA